MRLHRLVLVSLIVVAVLAQGASTKPPARNFQAPRMTGAQEVPPRPSQAHGVAVFNLSPDGTKLRFHLVVTRIRNVVGAHIHSGAVGVNGPIVFGMFAAPEGGGPHNGLLAQGVVVRGVTPLPPTLGAALSNAERFDALIALMRSGNSYVNVHTNDGVAPINTGPGDFPGGEIRAQVVGHP
ncbi:MAG: CHRD domain-containing protein [Gemmataceae bacterium]|nr:CHRD domain-containing protein [Gemmataceae bacterium]